MSADPEKPNSLAGMFLADMGGAFTSPSVLIREQMGLYKALAQAGPSRLEDLVANTRVRERYLREWLGGQAAAGYVESDAVQRKFLKTSEQQFALKVNMGPAQIPGTFYTIGSAYMDRRKIVGAVLRLLARSLSVAEGAVRWVRVGFRDNRGEGEPHERGALGKG
jgi:hypothetical protein